MRWWATGEIPGPDVGSRALLARFWTTPATESFPFLPILANKRRGAPNRQNLRNVKRTYIFQQYTPKIGLSTHYLKCSINEVFLVPPMWDRRSRFPAPRRLGDASWHSRRWRGGL